MTMADKIRAILKLAKINQGELAERLGVSQPTVHRWLKGSEPEGHRRDAINALHESLTDDAPAASNSTEVPVMGYLGAGAEVEPDDEQVPPDGLFQVTVPFPMPEDMIAFKVRGVSMLPVFKPDSIIVVYREQKKPLESFFGEEAAVRTAEGKRFIKTITRGSLPGTVNLMSWNDPVPIENQQVLWIGEIFAILPPAAIKKTTLQGGVQGQLRLKTA